YERGSRELADTTLGWRFVNPKLAERHYPYSMGETAENVAERWGVSRERQDAFALESHRRSVAAIEAGRFADQIVPVEFQGRKGDVTVVDRDEHPRADTSTEALGKRRPAFNRDGGSVTAGNSSGINDGAAAASSRCSPTSCGGPAAVLGSRRCASAWGRGSPRSSNASTNSAVSQHS